MAELLAPPNGERPALILDVDGVLRVDAEIKPEGYIAQPELPFAYNPALTGLLKVLLNDTDGYYISDWRDLCHEHIGVPLGLPELDWINDDPFRRHTRDMSSRASAINALFAGRAVVWADDEITDDDFTWGAQRAEPTFLAKTDHDRGLEPIDVELIAAWLSLLKTPQA